MSIHSRNPFPTAAAFFITLAPKPSLAGRLVLMWRLWREHVQARRFLSRLPRGPRSLRYPSPSRRRNAWSAGWRKALAR